MIDIDSIQGNPKFINTREFRRTSLFFKRYGRYTDAPKGTRDWYEFWEEEERRCIEGYKVGGVKITGRHYFYMNFTQLRKIEDEKKGHKIAAKDFDFPAFWELDYDWFWYKEIAWWGCTRKELLKLNLWRNPIPNTYIDDSGNNVLPSNIEDYTYGGGRHLLCTKARRGGFSYKEGADGVYNYHLIPGSKSYYFAAIEEYLTNDGILNKVEFDLEFLNQNTDGWWFKNRMQESTLMNQKATYKEKGGGIKGVGSEIIGVIINKPDKIRGKEGNKMVFEEAGSFPNLERAVGILYPSVKEGSTITGQISVFGTGGEEKGVNIEALERMFENPSSYDMLAFHNDWIDGVEAGECGVFVPHYMVNPSFMDLEGNVDIKGALAYDQTIINKLKAANNQKMLDQHKAEFPNIPSDSFIRTTNNDFPLAAIKAQEIYVKSTKSIIGSLNYGTLVNTAEGGLKFEIKPRTALKILDYYPHKNNEDLTGGITMVEAPQLALMVENGKQVLRIPKKTYLIVVDPYYKDDAADRTSLGVAVVYKLKNEWFDELTDREVAWYVGRPNKVEEFYDVVLDMADFYNATIQSELAGGGKGLFDKAKVRKKLHRLEFKPLGRNAKEVELEDKNRSYFMDLPDEDKRLLILSLSDWLKTPIGLRENGEEIWNLHYIYDIGYLQELRNFNDTGNFDRISARLVYQAMANQRNIVKSLELAKKAKSSLLRNRRLFGQEVHDPGLIMLDNDAII